MLLKGKKILIMGIRNKWSIAWGAAMSAYENGAKVIFTHHPTEKEEIRLQGQFLRCHSYLPAILSW